MDVMGGPPAHRQIISAVPARKRSGRQDVGQPDISHVQRSRSSPHSLSESSKALGDRLATIRLRRTLADRVSAPARASVAPVCVAPLRHRNVPAGARIAPMCVAMIVLALLLAELIAVVLLAGLGSAVAVHNVAAFTDVAGRRRPDDDCACPGCHGAEWAGSWKTPTRC